MVVDLKRLSESLRESTPENDLRRDLQRIIRSRKSEIEETLKSGKSFLLRVPDGRQIRISRRVGMTEPGQVVQPVPAVS